MPSLQRTAWPALAKVSCRVIVLIVTNVTKELGGPGVTPPAFLLSLPYQMWTSAHKQPGVAALEWMSTAGSWLRLAGVFGFSPSFCSVWINC